jgi:hypothetical protein
MMQIRNLQSGRPLVRTTLDISERDHALYTSLARAQRTSFSKLLLALAKSGLESANRINEAAPAYQVDPQTGLGVFRSGRPITLDDVKALENDDLPETQ